MWGQGVHDVGHLKKGKGADLIFRAGKWGGQSMCAMTCTKDYLIFKKINSWSVYISHKKYPQNKIAASSNKDHLIPNILTPHFIRLTEDCKRSDYCHANVPK